jgi:hypothetical protein
MTRRTKSTTDTAAANDAAAVVAPKKRYTSGPRRFRRNLDPMIVEAGGFQQAPRTRRVVADPDIYPRMSPWEDAPPFWAEIDDTLTFDEMTAIPADRKTTYLQQQEAIAPYVYAWNAWAYDEESEAWVAAPAPADYGSDIFATQTTHVTTFLVACLKYGRGTDLPKLQSRSESSDSGNDGDS